MSSGQSLVDNVRQARKVRVLTAAFVVLAAAACAWVASTSLSPVPDPTAFILAPLVVAAACGLVLYGRRYVVALRVASQTKHSRCEPPSARRSCGSRSSASADARCTRAVWN